MIKKMKAVLYCCGFNGFKQLKKSEDIILEEFTKLSIDNVVDVSFSWSSMFVRTDSEVFAMGQIREESGVRIRIAFDDGSNTAQSNSVQHMSSTFFRKQALLVTQSGECYIFNGDSNPHIKKVPDFTKVESDNCDGRRTENKIIKVCCGGYTNLALSSNLDKLYCIPSLVPLSGIKVKEIACGFEHNILTTDEGDVYTWGAGSRGQLGLGTLDDIETPTRVELPPITHIAAGGWHCFARTVHNVLFAWGWNSHGQLGFPSAKSDKPDSSVNVAAEPIVVPFPTDEPLTALGCGTRHTVLVIAERSVWGCGWTDYGQLPKSASAGLDCDRLTQLDVPAGKIRRLFAGGWNTALLIEPDSEHQQMPNMS